jgi:tetratricopeptide (TPR) repeat protein
MAAWRLNPSYSAASFGSVGSSGSAPKSFRTGACETGSASGSGRLRRYDEALAESRLALTDLDDEAFAHVSVARALIGLERYDEAITELHRATELEPRDANPWEELCVAEFHSGALGGARADCEEAYRRETSAHDSATTLTLIAEIDEEEGKFDAAEQAIGHVQELAPEDASGYYELAFLLEATGRGNAVPLVEDIAVDIDRDAREVHPWDRRWAEIQHVWSGLSAEARGDGETACAAWQSLQKIETSGQLHVEGLRGRAQVHLERCVRPAR